MTLIDRCAGLRPGTVTSVPASAKRSLRSLARRWLALDEEIKDHDRHRLNRGGHRQLMESSGARLQVELLDRRRWRTRLELSTALFEYLEIFHNRQRRHSALGIFPGQHLIRPLLRAPHPDDRVGACRTLDNLTPVGYCPDQPCATLRGQATTLAHRAVSTATHFTSRTNNPAQNQTQERYETVSFR
jgi:hypothetical protein